MTTSNNAVISSSGSTPTPPPPTETKPYVPPALRNRKKDEASTTTISLESPSYPTSYTSNKSKFNNHDKPNYSNKNSYFSNNHHPSSLSRAPGSSRWDQLSDASSPPRAKHNRFHNTFGGGGGDYGSNNSSSRFASSTTGTGWDVRHYRHVEPESPNEIFQTDGGERFTGINFETYENIPVKLSGPQSETIECMQSFKEAATVHPLLHENICRVDYEKPTPVQKYAIPVILAGKDLMACAQTGSGKTAAFLFPIITRMLQTGPPRNIPLKFKSDKRRTFYPVSLILSPTRELAVQIFKESRKFAYGTGIQTLVVYGGSPFSEQAHSIQRKGVDICVATPGRLSEMLTRGLLALQQVKYFVLDEADRMLDMGFSPQIHSIVENHDMPSSQKGRQTVMFSATFPIQIQNLASQFLKNYIFLTVGRVGSTNDLIRQKLVYAHEESKPKYLLRVLCETKGGLMLVFVETRRKADIIESFLIECGLRAVSLHGDKTQEQREHALHLFRTKQSPILVATDVAARGLDIHNIEHVINCDLPSRIEDYVHRIGRTGRAGNCGIATSFVNETNRPVLRALLSLLEESQQEIPNWFYELVKSCTSAHNKFSNSSNPFGGHTSGSAAFADSRNNKQQQSANRSSMQPSKGVISNNKLNNQRNTVKQYPATQTVPDSRDDEEDGW